MAIQSKVDEVKVVLKLTRGSHTVRKCNQGATDEAYYSLGQAVASLQAEGLDKISKVQTTVLSESTGN